MFSPQNNIINARIKIESDPERYFTIKELFFSFIIINIFIATVLIFSWASDSTAQFCSRISDGILDITGGDCAYIPLNGEWDFEWYSEIPEVIDKTLIPENFTDKKKVPGYWESGRGLGIYRLTIVPGNNIKIPAVKLTNVMDTYKLFVNRKEYYSVGNISPDPDKYIDESRPVVIPLLQSAEEIELCIMVGNLTEKRGGLNRILFFGEYDILKNFREKKLVFNSMLQGISLTVIFYNILFLFVNRKRGQTNNVFLIILCFTIIFFCGLKQEMILKTIFSGMTGETRAKLIYLSFLLPFPVFACYIKSVYPIIFGKKIYSSIISSAVFFTAFVVFFKSSIFSSYLLYMEAINLLLAIYLIIRLLYLFIKTKNTTPLTQLIGMYIFLAGFIAAILDDNLALPSNAPVILLTGFVVYLTAGNTILSIRAFNKLKQLHNALISSEKDKENLRKLSYIDSLTEVSNRRHFEEYIKLHWEKTTFIGETTALFMIDIDNFKIFNDTYGHQEGDICLKKTAAAMNRELNRENDILFRYGGEEFVVIISNITPEDSFRLAEKLRTNVENLKIPNKNSLYSDYVTVSIGVSYFDPAKKQTNWGTTLKEADSALYRAKIRKNCCLLYKEKKRYIKTGDII